MDKKVEGPKVLLNAVVFGDNEIDTSATDDVMLITDRQIKSQVDQDKLKKEEAARKKKLARREREEAALAAQKGPEAVKELAVASQGIQLQISQCMHVDKVGCVLSIVCNSEKENQKRLYQNLEIFLLKTLILHLVHVSLCKMLN